MDFALGYLLDVHGSLTLCLGQKTIVTLLPLNVLHQVRIGAVFDESVLHDAFEMLRVKRRIKLLRFFLG